MVASPGDWGRKRQPVNLDTFRRSNLQGERNRVSLPVVSNRSASTGALTEVPVHRSPNSPIEEAMSSHPLSAPIKLEMLKLNALSDEQRTSIHRAAQLVVVAAVCNRGLTQEWIASLGSMAELNVMGMFATLTRGKQLRGCCGFVGHPAPLQEAILSSVERTCKEDPRMPSISPCELPFLRLDVSLLASPIVLTVPAESRIEHIEIGKHGLKITRGKQSGLLLPSVPVEQNWTAKEFLEGVCRKAGLPESAWLESDTILETFVGTLIEGKMEPECLPAEMPIRRAPGNTQSLLQLKKVATQNLIALSRGATPTYFAADAMDGNVHGVVLSIVDSQTRKPLAHWIKTSLRNDMPLQSSLFDLCKAASEVLSKTRFQKETDIELEITVLFDTAHHGAILYEDWDGSQLKPNLVRCETEGFQPQLRAVVAVSGDRAAIAFDAAKSVETLMAEAATTIKSRRNPVGIYSLGCMSTADALLASNTTVAQSEDDVRKPAVADMFYPLATEARRSLVAKLQGSVAAGVSPKPALAMMTPHAGLRYSGQIAMDTWGSVKLPSTVLIIGPKHTPLGSDWAISPSRAWELPGGESWQTDLELVRKLVAGVEGFELDFAAHAREHGVEVQLPILESLSKGEARPKLVAIAMKSASYDEIMLASQQLADVLRGLSERPLLVISSDMNHFANEPENRRLDRMAVEAMLTGDPKKLMDVCMQNRISMCGLVPAALIMQTLTILGEPFQVEEIGYDNSASSGGDPARVVGYAGVVFRPI